MRRAVVRTFSWEGTLQRVWDFPAEQRADDAARQTIVMARVPR